MNNIPLNIDWQQILLHLFNFSILVGGLYLLLFKPVKNFMDKRTKHYQDMESAAVEREKATAEMEAAMQQRQAALDLTAVIARTVFVPGLTFWGGTILRDRLNLPRPYEQPGFEPLRHKETRGHSFPSRHALSASVLAMVWMYFYPKAGWVMVGITVLICVGRVLTGVHHIRDVVGGAALGFALGFAGMWLL